MDIIKTIKDDYKKIKETNRGHLLFTQVVLEGLNKKIKTYYMSQKLGYIKRFDKQEDGSIVYSGEEVGSNNHSTINRVNKDGSSCSYVIKDGVITRSDGQKYYYNSKNAFPELNNYPDLEPYIVIWGKEGNKYSVYLVVNEEENN